MSSTRTIRTMLVIVGCAWPTWVGADTETPTLTATISATVTITPTITITSTTPPPIAVVTLNHNRFDPQQSQTVEVMNLRPEHGRVTIKVYNAVGMLIRQVLDQDIIGYSPVSWNGRNEQNEIVASGVYYVVVTGNRLHKRLRIAVIK